jgi:hypothetical protein
MVTLTKYVHAACPHQAIDDYTPDAWHDIIGDLSLAECRAAVAAMANDVRFIAPCDIRKHADSERRAEAGRRRVAELNGADPARAVVHEIASRQPARKRLEHPVAVGAIISELGIGQP